MIRFKSRGEVRRYLPGVTRDAPEDRREERENDLIRAAIHLVRPSFVVRPVTYAAVRALADAVGVPPEWVWVPLPELPDVPTKVGPDEHGFSLKDGNTRPLRVDDRVPLTVPCPDDPQDGRMHGCRVWIRREWCRRCRKHLANLRPWDRTFFAQHGVDCPHQIGSGSGRG